MNHFLWTSGDVREGNTNKYFVYNLTNSYNSVDGNILRYDTAGNLTKDKDGYNLLAKKT